MDYEQIMKTLIDEAVINQPTGWLSNNEDATLNQRGDEIEITTYSGDVAYVDIGHLAGIVSDIIEQDRAQRDERVADDA